MHLICALYSSKLFTCIDLFFINLCGIIPVLRMKKLGYEGLSNLTRVTQGVSAELGFKLKEISSMGCNQHKAPIVIMLRCIMCLHAKSLSRVQLFVTPCTVPHQAPLSMGFSRKEYWSGLPCPPPGDFPNPGIEPASPTLQVAALPLSHWGSPDASGTW